MGKTKAILMQENQELQDRVKELEEQEWEQMVLNKMIAEALSSVVFSYSTSINRIYNEEYYREAGIHDKKDHHS